MASEVVRVIFKRLAESEIKNGTGSTFKPIFKENTTIKISTTNTTLNTSDSIFNQDAIEVHSGVTFTHVIIPIGAVLFVLLLAVLVIIMLKKSRLDKLRHHLMPLYNFDPAEEEEDWETELLEEGYDHRPGPRNMVSLLKNHGSFMDESKLAFQGDSGL